MAESTPLPSWLCSVLLWGVLLVAGLLVVGLLAVGLLIAGFWTSGLFIVELRKVIGDCVSIASNSLNVGSRF